MRLIRLALVLMLQVMGCSARSAPPPDMSDWLHRSLDAPAAQTPSSRPAEMGLRVLRQDHGQLRLGQSVMQHLLKVGSDTYTHGLGTHANSDIALTLPAGATHFRSLVGIDTDDNPAGSVVFIVEADGKELFRSGVCHSGEKAVPVDVALPKDARELRLKTDTTADGANNDHADWAQAKLVLADGKEVWLDEVPMTESNAAAESKEFLAADRPPFSFTYDGRSSREFLSRWKQEVGPSKEAGGVTTEVRTWTDPNTGLKLTATSRTFKGFPAAEWLLHFENTGSVDTPMIENVQTLDLAMGTHPADQPVILHQIAGSDASERDFVPSERAILPGQEHAFAPNGGRSSDRAFPFFNVQFGDRGVIAAIGWTGQWRARVGRSVRGGTYLAAGMERMHLRLHPGESIRGPRILVLNWEGGDWIDGQNVFRRLLLAHYIPRLNGQPVQCCIGAQTFNLGGPRGRWGTEAGQIDAARINKEIGCDTLWMDAGWFVGDFPNGVGNWVVKPQQFPRGLKPVADECHKLGLKWLIWWEPERVAPGTRIAVEHPEMVLGGAGGGLFNLGDPKARRWLTDLLDKQIGDFGVDCYRNDFNIEPLPFWKDEPDRVGMSEIRYVEGLYAMWDELAAKHPGIWFDNCASGGRRIDIEMLMRAVVQTRSDAACAPGRADWDQSQTYGLSLFIPCHATICWDLDTYSTRSIATGGFLGEWDILSPQFDKQRAKAGIDEIRENQKYWYGDYYPLTPWSLSDQAWMAYQFHRSDLDEGIILAFRRAKSAETELRPQPRGLRPQQNYVVRFIDENRLTTEKRMTGAELAGVKLRIDQPRASLLVRYREANAR